MSCPGCFLNIKTVQFVLFQGDLSQIASCGRENYFVFKMVLHAYIMYECVLLVKTTQSPRVEGVVFPLLSGVSLNPLLMPLKVSTANSLGCPLQAFWAVCLYTCCQVRREAASEQHR